MSQNRQEDWGVKDINNYPIWLEIISEYEDTLDLFFFKGNDINLLSNFVFGIHNKFTREVEKIVKEIGEKIDVLSSEDKTKIKRIEEIWGEILVANIVKTKDLDHDPEEAADYYRIYQAGAENTQMNNKKIEKLQFQLVEMASKENILGDNIIQKATFLIKQLEILTWQNINKLCLYYVAYAARKYKNNFDNAIQTSASLTSMKNMPRQLLINVINPVMESIEKLCKTFKVKLLSSNYVNFEKDATIISDRFIHNAYSSEILNRYNLFLMSSNQSSEFKQSDQSNLYLYKQDDNEYHYYIPGSNDPQIIGKKDVTEIIQDIKFDQPSLQPKRCDNDEFCKAVLGIPLKRNHILKHELAGTEFGSQVTLVNSSKTISLDTLHAKFAIELYLTFDDITRANLHREIDSNEYLCKALAAAYHYANVQREGCWSFLRHGEQGIKANKLFIEELISKNYKDMDKTEIERAIQNEALMYIKAESIYSSNLGEASGYHKSSRIRFILDSGILNNRIAEIRTVDLKQKHLLGENGIFSQKVTYEKINKEDRIAILNGVKALTSGI